MDGAISSGGWRSRVERLARVGVLPTDPPDEALRKETLVLAAAFIAAVAVVWVAIYSALGLYLPASIPFAYQLSSVANLVWFARTKRYRFFRACELGLSLVLPFLLQLSLGGFVASSGVVLWSFTAPLGALLFAGRRDAARWFLAFLVIVVVSAAVDPSLPSRAAEIPDWLRLAFFALNTLGVTATCFLLMQYFVRERDRAEATAAAERERSERLLLNVLPEPIAARLKAGEIPHRRARRERPGACPKHLGCVTAGSPSIRTPGAFARSFSGRSRGHGLRRHTGARGQDRQGRRCARQCHVQVPGVVAVGIQNALSSPARSIDTTIPSGFRPVRAGRSGGGDPRAGGSRNAVEGIGDRLVALVEQVRVAVRHDDGLVAEPGAYLLKRRAGGGPGSTRTNGGGHGSSCPRADRLARAPA